MNEKIILKVLEKAQENLCIFPWADLEKKYYPPLSSNQNVLILGLFNKTRRMQLAQLLKKIHPPQKIVMCFQQNSQEQASFQVLHISIAEMETREFSDEFVAIYVPTSLNKNSMLDFLELIAHLRSPQGCPWDREQNHQSLRPNLLEETYEVLQAIDKMDVPGMQEELGDLLLQIVLQAQIASENDEFNFEDVVTSIEKKLIYRHPHVFGETAVANSDEVIKNWEVIKAQERRLNQKAEGLLQTIPKEMSALSLAQAYQKRAARVGFDWESITSVKQKVMEELHEVETAKDDEERSKELGDVLFTLVNLIRWYGYDAESVLREAAERFATRFHYIESCVQSQGKTFAEYSLAELDAFWEEAKKINSLAKEE